MSAIISDNILEAKKLLDQGQLVAIPTETVYGLAANALNVEAVSQIFSVKNRPKFDPLIIHVSGLDQIERFAFDISDDILKLAEEFSPGPITFLVKKRDEIPDLVTSGLDRVAIRIPNHTITLDLLKSLDYPLAAPSANPFGYVSPTTSAHVYAQLGSEIPYILEGGPCQVGLESTIVGEEDGHITIYRKGGLEIESIEDLLGKKIQLKEHSSSNPIAPGMLEKHYSPGKSMRIVESLKKGDFDSEKTAFLGFNKKHPYVKKENQFLLSEKSDLKQAAQRLFTGLRFLDNPNFEQVLVQLLPEIGLGRAINDRLKRAAAN
jgi:L-threonylcarbamoyladenylate synthase